MTVPDELDGMADDLATAISERVSDQVADEVVEDLMGELPPEIAEAVGGDLEPMPPAEGIERYLQEKSEEVAGGTLQQYRQKMESVDRYLTDELGLDSLDELSARQAEDFKRWRRYESLDREEPMARKTLKDDMHLFQGFLRYMARLRAVSADAYEAVEIPSLKHNEGVDRRTLDRDRAGNILEFLDRFRYGKLSTSQLSRVQ
jgi:hypothetical protein